MKLTILMTAAICFIGGVVVGVIFEPEKVGQFPSTKEYREGQQGLINPLLECDVEGNFIDSPKTGFSPIIQKAVDDIIAEGKIEDISVYYRDLNNGPFFGINETEAFLPSSLLKVPLLLVILKGAEAHPEYLERKVLYEKPFPQLSMWTQNIIPKQEIELGKSYTVEDLLNRMIKYSDNKAMFLLGEQTDIYSIERLHDLYQYIGVPESELQANGTILLTARRYAGFFRILFNASYLDREHSQKALEILTGVQYNEALPGNLPDGTVVAHKFGESREVGTGQIQFHDCGIVYHKQGPYTACIMTRGGSFEEASDAIKTISELMYNEVAKTPYSRPAVH